MNRLLAKLSGGDLRSDGRANEVAEEVTQNPALLEQLFDGLSDPDDVIRETGFQWSDGIWPWFSETQRSQ